MRGIHDYVIIYCSIDFVFIHGFFLFPISCVCTPYDENFVHCKNTASECTELDAISKV